MHRATDDPAGSASLPDRAERCISRILPLLQQACSRERLLRTLRTIVRSDRRNSFDGFAETADFLLQEAETAGLDAERYLIPTGAGNADGRWRINWAADMVTATLDMVFPEERRIAHYDDNPWEVIQWTLATPPDGLLLDLVAIDSTTELESMPHGALQGCAVLTATALFQQQHNLVRAGAEAVISDRPVKDLPEATQWTKFGWGGLPVGTAGARLPGMALSAAKGALLRRTLSRRGSVKVRMTIQTREYHGYHDVVSARLRGAADPQNDVWAIAHTYEPGAIDNASGVAASLEALRLLRVLVQKGAIAAPRRSIRMLGGFECYGFFHYLETVKRLQPPLAGLVVDCVGACARVSDGSIGWHATVPSSAGFVNDLGLAIMRRAYARNAPSFSVRAAPFASTEDTMIGDPAYGFPCAYLGTFPYRGYHSSADTIECVDPEALAAAAIGTAAYLYYFAQANSDDVLELAAWVPASRMPLGGNLKSDEALVQAAARQLEDRLARLLWGGVHRDLRRDLRAALASKHTPARSRPRKEPMQDRRVPFRRRPLGPTYENVPVDLKETMRRSGVHKWALYWADGSRDLDDIRLLANAEKGTRYSGAQIASFFEALAAIGYVSLVDPAELVTREQLQQDLARLGVTPGMDLMVHSSLSSIGWVRGGADAVVDALLAAIGSEGTLLMPSFNHRAAEVFNPLTTPTTNGAIPDAFWRRAETIRSLHPTHAVAAQGPKAEAWCANHLAVGIWAAESPIGRLVHEGGHILGLGVDHTTSTAYHVAEMSMNVPCLDPFGGLHPVVMPDGTMRQATGLLWRDGACPVPPERLSEDLDAMGLQKHGHVGRAPSVLVSAKILWETRRRHLRDVCWTCTIRPKRR